MRWSRSSCPCSMPPRRWRRRRATEICRFEGRSRCPGNNTANLRTDAAFYRDTLEASMVRDIRTSPRGLIAPLKQSELASLRDLQEGKLGAMPQAHRERLYDLELIAV